MYSEAFARIVDALPAACLAVYGERLKALALFGSVARRTMRPDSDIDLFLVVESVPEDPAARRTEFEGIERRLAGMLDAARANGVHTFLAPVLKTPAEMR